MPTIQSNTSFSSTVEPFVGVACSVVNYRFSFNNKASDNEIYGEKNAFDFEARMYDPRLGRWLTVDTLSNEYGDISPFLFVANNPIFLIDINGKEIIIYSQKPKFLGLFKDKITYKPGMVYTGNDDFVKNAIKSLDAVYSYGGSNEIDFLVNHRRKIRIRYQTIAMGSANIDAITGAIGWNPFMGWEDVQLDEHDKPQKDKWGFPLGNNTFFSPARALYHELLHKYFKLNKKAIINNQGEFSKNRWGSKIEFQVIQRENEVFRDIEGFRSSTYGRPNVVDDPLKHERGKDPLDNARKKN